MRRILLLSSIFFALVLAPIQATPAATGSVWVLPVDGAIGPATADFVTRNLDRARDQGVSLLVLRMDTPGGLDSAMREIVQAILASSLPVVTYVAPPGGRAASAGVYILYASHIAAMAPGTNTGAATPVTLGGLPSITPAASPTGGDSEPGPQSEAKGARSAKDDGDTMQRKLINDASAYLQSLAKLRGRNADWARQAVRQSASLSADDALALGVIDLVADDLTALLQALDGRQVSIGGQTRVLHTAGATIQIREPDWRNRFLAIIASPNVAYMLLLLGIYGLFFEIANPGMVLPGVAGAVSLLLALYAFQVLPVDYTGVGLILLGIGFMLAEIFVPSFGALGIGGIIAFVVGSIILMQEGTPGYTLSPALIAGVTLTTAVFFLGLAGKLLALRRRPPVTGKEEMRGSHGEVIAVDKEGLLVRVHGETWQARSDSPLNPGQEVEVAEVEGLTLVVRPLN